MLDYQATLSEPPKCLNLVPQEKLDTGSQSLNVLRVQKYLDKTRMKELARDNMPFMGLDIHGLKEVDLTQVPGSLRV